MRYAILAGAGLLVATPAVAEPCAVTIVRAPGDVREVVEDALDDEPVCRVPLEVRIVPTDGGFYLLARDDRGRVHERTVPDATAVAVLVTSWAADDGTISPPGVAAPEPAPVAVEHVAAAPASPRWLTVDGLIGTDTSTKGGRVAVDLFSTGAWSFGIAASVSTTDDSLQFVTPDGSGTIINTRDVIGTAYVSYAMTSDHWYLRPAVAVGFVMTTVNATTMWYFNAFAPTPQATSDVSPTVELSAMLGYTFTGQHWAIEVGPTLTRYSQDLRVADTGSAGPNFTPPGPDVVVTRNDFEWTLLAGLRHRL